MTHTSIDPGTDSVGGKLIPRAAAQDRQVPMPTSVDWARIESQRFYPLAEDVCPAHLSVEQHPTTGYPWRGSPNAEHL